MENSQKEIQIFREGNISYQILQEHHLEKAIDILTETFVNNNEYIKGMAAFNEEWGHIAPYGIGQYIAH